MLTEEEVVPLLGFVVPLDSERILWSELLKLAAKIVGLGMERLVVDVQRGNLGDHFLERTAPFCLEPLPNGRAAAVELRVAELGLVQLVVDRARLPAHVPHRMLPGFAPAAGGLNA